MADQEHTPSQQRVAFDHIKSAQFRVIHVDGAVGGATPQGLMHIALYSERSPIPRRVVNEITEAGQVGAIVPEMMIVRDALVREVEVDAIMTLPVAENLHKWLGERIADLKKIIEGGNNK